MSHLTIQQLVAQTDGELSGPSLKLVEKHLAECEACWQELEGLAEQDALLASVVAIEPGEEFFEDLAAVVEAEISGKKKPAPRATAPAAPAAQPRPAPVPPPPPPPPLVRQQPASPPVEPNPEPLVEVPRSAPEPVAPAVPAEPAEAPVVADSAPVPRPAATGTPAERAPGPAIEPRGPDLPLELLAVGEPLTPIDSPPLDTPVRVNPDLVETWRPPKPTPDDPFADLVPPRRAAPKPAPAVTAPRPPAPRVERSAPAPAHKPAAAPVAPPAPPVPSPPIEPTEPRRRSPAVAILIGIGAFIAGIAVAVLVVMRVTGYFALHRTSPPRTEPVVAAAQNPPPAAPVSVPAPETPPAVEVVVPPAVLPEPVHASATAPAKPRAHAPRHVPSAGDGAALNAPSTTVVPVRVIHTETVAPANPPPAPAPAPAVTAPAADLGVLCGTVLDTDSHPVARAQVMMADVGVVVLTDRAGHFCLTAPVGTRTLSVVALGFTSVRRLVTLGKRTPELSVMLMSAAPFPTPH